jgi:hypothetical protein
MTPQLHAARAARVLSSLAKLDPGAYEMRIEAAMLAGTQLLNVALHELGITAASDDIMHAEYMGGPVRIKADLLAPGLVDLLLQIEMLRPGHVRGDLSNGEEAGARAMDLLAQLRRRVFSGREPTIAAVADH